MSKSQEEPQPIQKRTKIESPQKRRGRPEKKGTQLQLADSDEQQLFSMHDNVFHAAILFYTFRIFDKAPTRSKFNPTIGFSIYEKVKSIPEDFRRYYDDDQVAEKWAEPWKQNHALRRFFINAMTFGPKCVIDEFYRLFCFILNNQPSVQETMAFVLRQNNRYMFFNGSVMDTLEAKTSEVRDSLVKIIKVQILKLLEIVVHTVLALKKGEKENKFVHILQSEQDLFERGVNSKPQKKVKKQGD